MWRRRKRPTSPSTPPFSWAPFDPWLAKEAVKAVVGPQRHKALGLEAVAAPENLLHRRFQVVVADTGGHAAEVLEGADVAVQEDFLALVQVGPGVSPPRRRQAHDEHLHLGGGTGQDDRGRAEVDLGLLAQRVALRDGHLGQRELLAGPHLGHKTPHGGLAQVGAVLFDQSLPDPPSAMSLFSGCFFVLFQPGFDHWLPGADLGCRPSWGRFAGRGQRRRQRLADIAPVHVKTLGQGAHAHAFALVCFADLLVHAHLRPLWHPPTLRAGELRLLDPGVGPNQVSTSRLSGAKSDEHTHRKGAKARRRLGGPVAALATHGWAERPALATRLPGGSPTTMGGSGVLRVTKASYASTSSALTGRSPSRRHRPCRR